MRSPFSVNNQIAVALADDERGAVVRRPLAHRLAGVPEAVAVGELDAVEPAVLVEAVEVVAVERRLRR